MIIAVLRENKSRIKKFVFGASGYSENADNEQTELDASTEKLNQLAEVSFLSFKFKENWF